MFEFLSEWFSFLLMISTDEIFVLWQLKLEGAHLIIQTGKQNAVGKFVGK